MTECKGLPLTFSRLGRRKIRRDLNGGWLTSDAGAALLREADQRIGLIDAMAACIEDAREPAKITRSVRRIVPHLAGGYPLQALFTRIPDRLRGLPLVPT